MGSSRYNTFAGRHVEMATIDPGTDAGVRGEVEDIVRKQLRDRSPTGGNVSKFKFHNSQADKNSVKSGSMFGKSQKSNVAPGQLAPVNMLAQSSVVYDEDTANKMVLDVRGTENLVDKILELI